MGEISLITHRSYSADCEAKTDVELLLLTPEDFESLSKQIPELEQGLRNLAAERLEENKLALETNIAEQQRWAALAIDAIHHGNELRTADERSTRSSSHKNASLAIRLGILLDGIPESFIIGSTMIAAVAAMTAAGGEPSFWSVLPYTLDRRAVPVEFTRGAIQFSADEVTGNVHRENTSTLGGRSW